MAADHLPLLITTFGSNFIDTRTVDLRPTVFLRRQLKDSANFSFQHSQFQINIQMISYLHKAKVELDAKIEYI